jgi:hypothetical protein
MTIRSVLRQMIGVNTLLSIYMVVIVYVICRHFFMRGDDHQEVHTTGFILNLHGRHPRCILYVSDGVGRRGEIFVIDRWR